ncbi:MAG: NAD(P)-binding domain-containing protein [Rhizobiaceae bacterium]
MENTYGHTVGVIGTGRLGSAIAALLARAGIATVIGGRKNSAQIGASARSRGSALGAGAKQAADAEIVVLAVPWSAAASVLGEVADWEGRILIDATNVMANGVSLDEDAGSSSEVLVTLAVGAHVVKCLNTLPAALLASGPDAAGGRRVLFMSGDHRRAKKEVARLLRHMGFAPIDLGGLALGARLQSPGGPLFGIELVQPTLSPVDDASA